MEVEVKLVNAIAVDVELCTPVVVRDGFQPITLTNSAGSIQIVISEFPMGGSYELSDTTHTDSDGSPAVLPALVPFEATACPVFELVLIQSSGKTYSVTASSGETVILPDSVIREVNGSTTIIEATTNYNCQWYTLELINSDGDIVDTIPTFPTNGKKLLADVTHTDSNGDAVVKPAGVPMVCTPGEAVANSPNIIFHRQPSYPSASPGDYPDLYNSGYFSKYAPTAPVNMRRLGANAYVLHADTPNPFGTTARYTSTDGTPSDTGTARFSSYGTGVADVVIDWLFDIIWKATPEAGTNSINNAQAKIDALNTANFAGINTWVSPSRDMFTLSANPDSNVDIHTSPNLIIDSGTRRYVTCERYPSVSSGWIVLNWGGEGYQSLTTTVSSSTYTVACALLTDAQIQSLLN